MEARFRAGASELHADTVVAAPAHQGLVGNTVDRHIKAEAFGNDGIGGHLEFSATGMLVAHDAGDFRIVDAGDDRRPFEHPLPVLAFAMVRFLLGHDDGTHAAVWIF